ncbi:hypothetical protein ACFP63_09870 [Oerskovia jenensis]|uniref:Hemagglutinin n=1 Tax=Oerskovia jenensis TaxID=162169 RepID=A0ABS2LIX0_9CELL|nr:hypothetical protein [Oerskovia jenensis]MBM7480366.1 hypothetical protein [Oerskovia jenensis]
MIARVRQALLAALTALGLIAAGLVAVAPAAQAAPVVGFNPGMIISDAIFYDSNAMSAGSVQSFLNSTGSGCVASAGNVCIKDYRETTPTRPATSLCKGGYSGGGSESAAEIIAKVSRACGINPQVLLVTLQKEQGLITASAGKSAATYARALGFGCPDNVGGWCDPQYAGFTNQVYSAAQQFQRYAANPTGYAHRAGTVNQVRYHPNASCGSSAVFIENQATAGLYNYTPYQPNAAALAAGTGSGNSCSSYGNRNFYIFFTSWFGSTQQRTPVGNVESLQASGTDSIQVGGWAFDPDSAGSVEVHVYVNGRGYAYPANLDRPDVGNAYGRSGKVGFNQTIVTGPGAQNVCVYAIDSSGGANSLLTCRTVTVTNNAPTGNVESLRSTGTGVEISGWAFDPDNAGSTEVHVYVNGRGYAYPANLDRPDVGNAYRRSGKVGFNQTIATGPGAQNVCVYAIDTSGGANTTLGCSTVTVTNNAPTGNVESLKSTGTGVEISGWAFDPDNAGSTEVHVYVNGRGYAYPANLDRPDVGNAYRRSGKVGFNQTIATGPGAQNVCVYAIDTSGGANTTLGCSTVTVTNNAPTGNVESLKSTGTGVEISGWAFDPDNAGSTDVHVYVNGRGYAYPANLDRPDVGNAYRRSGKVGFNQTIATGPGAQNVCVYAIDTNGGAPTTLGCSTVTVTARLSAPQAAPAPATPPTPEPTDEDLVAPSPSPSVDPDIAPSVPAPSLDGTGSGSGSVGGAGSDSVGPGSGETEAQAGRFSADLDIVEERPGQLRIAGWARGDGIDPVSIVALVDGVPVALPAPAEDVTDVVGSPVDDDPFSLLADLVRPEAGDNASYGFDLLLDVAPGSHEVCIQVLEDPDEQPLVCRTVTIA